MIFVQIAYPSHLYANKCVKLAQITCPNKLYVAIFVYVALPRETSVICFLLDNLYYV